jgi:hypothetical protein
MSEPDCEVSYLDSAQAFSGRVKCEGSTVTWRHDLDTRGRPDGYEDCAEVERRADVLIERGSDYLEMWRRPDTVDGPSAVFERRANGTGVLTDRLVIVSELVVVVSGGPNPGGVAIRFGDGDWDVEARVGTGQILWAAVTSARSGNPSAGWSKVA